MIKLKREVKVGIFAVVTLAALYWGINFLRGSDLFTSNNKYYATYEQVNGVQKSAPITIKGFKVGVISDISYDPSRSEKIVLEFSIKSKFRIPENSKAVIVSDGLLGNKAVEIELGTSELYLDSGDTLRSEMDKGLFEIAGSELEFLKQKVNTLTNDISTTLGNINNILTANEATITSSLTNLSQITGTINNVLKSEENTIRAIVSDLNGLSATLKGNTGRIDNIIGNVEGLTDSLSSANIPELVNNLAVTIDNFNTTLTKVNSNEGTLGKLLGDDTLYDSLVMASSNLARLLDDLKAHPGRYIHLSVFGNKK